MRIFLVILLWIGMVGGLALYTRARSIALPRHTPAASQPSGGHITLEITPTFTAAPDPFALRTSAEPPPALLVRLNGRAFSRISDTLEAGKSIHLDPADTIAAGTNDLFLEASPPADQSDQSHALRVRIYRDALLLADQTLWSEPGGKILGSVSFTGAAAGAATTQEHLH